MAPILQNRPGEPRRLWQRCRAWGKSPAFWLSLAGLSLLALLFVGWLVWTPATLPGRIAALGSAAFFAALGLRFVPQWLRFWGGSSAGSAPKPPRWAFPFAQAKLFFALLGFDAGVLLLVHLLRSIAGEDGGFLSALAFWRCVDSAHYLDIAAEGYLSAGDWDRLVQLVFLPGYPAVVRLAYYVVGDYLWAGLLVSALAFASAGVVFYRLLRLDSPHREAIRAVKYLCLLPGAFFFAAPMSESLFLLCTACSLYGARTGRWLRGGLWGALAAFTRSLGLTLAVPLLFELIAQRPQGRRAAVGRAACILLIPAGFSAYCAINYLVAGNPFQFMEYQSQHWNQRLGLFFHTAAYQTELALSALGANPQDFWGLWLPNLAAAFGSLLLMVLAARRLRASYTAWFLAYFAIAIGATWLLSAPRYLAAFLPLPAAIASLTRRRWANRLTTAGLVAASLGYLYAFAMRWNVW